jgi:hypothetical protein
MVLNLRSKTRLVRPSNPSWVLSGRIGPRSFHCLSGDNQGGIRIASFGNAPEQPRRCLTRMLPRHHQNVNRCRIGLGHVNGLGQDKAPAFQFDCQACFPVPTWR